MTKAAPTSTPLECRHRTEYEVVADVVVALIDAKFIKASPQVLVRIAGELQIPLQIIRDAWRRRDEGKVIPIRPVAVEEKAPPPAPTSIASRERPGPKPWKQTVTEKQRNNLVISNAKRKAAKEPVEGLRICSAPCHEGERLIPKTEFSVKDKATGSLRAWCKACMKIYVKSRYLSSEQLKRLGPVLHFVLGEGDVHVGVECPDCHKPCEVGQEVIAPAEVLHHLSCLTS